MDSRPPGCDSLSVTALDLPISADGPAIRQAFRGLVQEGIFRGETVVVLMGEGRGRRGRDGLPPRVDRGASTRGPERGVGAGHRGSWRTQRWIRRRRPQFLASPALDLRASPKLSTSRHPVPFLCYGDFVKAGAVARFFRDAERGGGVPGGGRIRPSVRRGTPPRRHPSHPPILPPGKGEIRGRAVPILPGSPLPPGTQH